MCVFVALLCLINIKAELGGVIPRRYLRHPRESGGLLRRSAVFHGYIKEVPAFAGITVLAGGGVLVGGAVLAWMTCFRKDAAFATLNVTYASRWN